MKKRSLCRKCQTAQRSPVHTLAREAEAAKHLQAAKMVELEEVKERTVPVERGQQIDPERRGADHFGAVAR